MVYLALFLVFVTMVTHPAESLVVGRVDARLPTGRSDVRTFYDGDDGIYVMGGTTINATGHSAYYDDVLQYSISTDSIKLVGTLPGKIASGGAGSDGSGAFFYLGGTSSGACSAQISQLAPDAPSAVPMAILPRAVNSFGTASDGAGHIFVVGGNKCSRPPQLLEIVQFDARTNVSTVAGYLPPFVYLSNMPAVWLNDAVYVFGGFDGYAYNTRSVIVRFHPISGISEILGAELPFGMDGHTGVVVGKYAYLIGGVSMEWEANHITRFDSETETVEVLEAINFPPLRTDAEAVYVPKTNRIYVFGGKGYGSGTDTDEILYIELN